VIVLRPYKTELDLNNHQKTACICHAGAARFAFNRGLARKQEAFAQEEKTPSVINLYRELNAFK